MNKKIVAEPMGGLCNRMFFIASTSKLSSAVDTNLEILWNVNNELGIKFDELFDPIEKISFTYRSNLAHKFHRFIQNRGAAFYKNVFLYDFDKIFLNADFLENEDIIKETNFVEQLNGSRKIYLQFFNIIYEYGEFDFSIFKIKAELKEELNKVVQLFNSNTVGLHIRRTDNVYSIKNSPIEAFIDKINKEIELNPDSKFYLATDDQNTEKFLLGKYGDKIIIYSTNKERSSKDGIKQALIDLYALSNTKLIFGSHGSTFSYMASLLGKAKLQIV